MKQGMGSEQERLNRMDYKYLWNEYFDVSDFLYIYNTRIHEILKK